MSILRSCSFTFFNCKLSHLSLRKWRGLRRKRRGYRGITLTDFVKRMDTRLWHDDFVDALCRPNDAFRELQLATSAESR